MDFLTGLIDAPPIVQIACAFLAYKSPDAYRQAKEYMIGPDQNGHSRKTKQAVEKMGEEVKPGLQDLKFLVTAQAKRSEELVLILTRIETKIDNR